MDGVLFRRSGRCLICYPAGLAAEGYAVPDGIREIGDYAFACCESPRRVTLPDTLTRIGARAFLRCGALASVNIPASVTRIGGGAFRLCSISLTADVTRDSAAAPIAPGTIFCIPAPTPTTG